MFVLQLLGLDGSLVFLELVFWVVSSSGSSRSERLVFVLQLLGLDGSLVFLEHVFWVVSLNTLFILVFGTAH